MNMGKTGWICNDRICHERSSSRIDQIDSKVIGKLMQMGPIPSLEARPPTAGDNLEHGSAISVDRPASNRLHMRQQSGILHHKRHHIFRISTNLEVLESILSYKVSECE